MPIFVMNRRYQLARHELCRAVDERDDALRERDVARQARDKALQQSNEALADRDRLREQLERLTHRPRHLVFFHIPRTGGSSIWHALAAAADVADVPIVDLFHLARQDYGCSDQAYSVLTERQQFVRERSTLIHLLTPHNIGYFFDAANVVYATVVRDPIDRFLSDMCHLREALPQSTDGDRETFIRRAGWQPAFCPRRVRRRQPPGRTGGNGG